MKLVEAIIRHNKLEPVKDAIAQQGVAGMTVIPVRGYGRQRGHTEVFRGAEYKVDYVAKLKLEVVVPDTQVAAVVDAIARTAATGQVGDGKIFVRDVATAVRIRTGEIGESAV